MPRDHAHPVPSRRKLLATVAGGAGGVILGGVGVRSATAGPSGPRRRIYVLVVDGCRPDEVRPVLMPRLSELRDEGTTYPAAQSLPVMETIPNHVMMMSGVRPDRSQVPANSVYDPAERAVRDLDRSADLRATTVFELLRDEGLSSGTVLSKRYLYGIFGTRADVRWKPEPLLPVTEHAPDSFTADAAIAMIDGSDPDLLFVNLGDVDPVGHSDVTGTTVEAARKSALADTDRQVGRLIDHLEETGKWSTSVVLVLADHSMDWSLPTAMITLAPVLDADPSLRDRYVIAQNGGADLLYWTGPEESRDRAVARMRELVAAQEGVLSVHAPGQLRLGDRAGDLVAYARPGYRFSDPRRQIPSPATTVIRRPRPSPSSSPAARPSSAAARSATLTPARSTWPRRSPPCTGWAPPRAAGTAPREPTPSNGPRSRQAPKELVASPRQRRLSEEVGSSPGQAGPGFRGAEGLPKRAGPVPHGTRYLPGRAPKGRGTRHRVAGACGFHSGDRGGGGMSDAFRARSVVGNNVGWPEQDRAPAHGCAPGLGMAGALFAVVVVTAGTAGAKAGASPLPKWAVAVLVATGTVLDCDLKVEQVCENSCGLPVVQGLDDRVVQLD